MNMKSLSMDEEMWRFWCYRMNSFQPIEHCKDTRLKYPDRGFKRVEFLEKVGWSTTLPPLNLPFWWRTKWITPDEGYLFRAEVISLYLVRNTHTGVDRVEFDFNTESFDDVDKKWSLI
jgi:hypothetical protein